MAPALHPQLAGQSYPLLLWGLLALAGVLYIGAAIRQRQRGHSWRLRRTLSFLAGLLAIAAAFLPNLSAAAHQSLQGHMLQHLLLGMFAPLGLVFAAPVSLLLRSVPVPLARACVRLLQWRPLAVIGHPLTAWLLNVGCMYLLYLTPLYALSLQSPAVHAWLHLHFLVAGCLFTWAIAGPDPASRRPAFAMRLWVLFLSMATHATLAKLMVAYGWPRGLGYSIEEIEVAAQWMYYGGDLAEAMLLAVLLWGRARRSPGGRQTAQVLSRTV